MNQFKNFSVIFACVIQSMIKKITAIFFILMANIILLAHIAVPHRHIDGIAHIFFHHSHSHGQSHEHDVPDSNNNDNDHGNSYFCLLNQPIQVTRFEFNINSQNNEKPVINNLILWTTNDIIIPHFFNIPPPFFDIPSSLYSTFINNGLGLRAPPVV